MIDFIKGWTDALMKRRPMSVDSEYLAGWDEGMRFRYHEAISALGELS